MTDTGKGSLATVILAAGKGTRMKSDLPKVLHRVRGKPMVFYVIELARAVGSLRIIVVIGHRKELVKRELRDEEVLFADQDQQLGTAHAVQMAERHLVDFDGEVLVLSGDVPLLGERVVRDLFALHYQSAAAATLLVGIPENPHGYGRVLRDADGFVDRIIEEKDASEAEKAIREVNIGTYVFNSEKLRTALPRVKNDNAQGEYYLPDVVKLLRKDGERVAALTAPDFRETMGINTVEQLREVEAFLEKNG